MTPLCETFDIDPIEIELNSAKTEIEDTKNKISVLREEVSTSQKYDIQDRDYIRYELQQLITTNNNILTTMGDMCKNGANARIFEVYSTLATTVANNLKELANINKITTDYQLAEDREKLKRETFELKKSVVDNDTKKLGVDGQTYVQNNNYNFTSEQMLDLINELKIPKQRTNQEDLPQFNLE